MSTVEDYLNELQRALHIRGRLRRRLLAECHDHLQDSTAQYGPDEAIRRFGSAQEIAASMNTEVAAHRAQRATHVTIFAVLVVAGSTMVLLHSSDSRATAPAGWAIVFFAAAQTAALCTALAALQGLPSWRPGSRYSPPVAPCRGTHPRGCCSPAQSLPRPPA